MKTSQRLLLTMVVVATCLGCASSLNTSPFTHGMRSVDRQQDNKADKPKEPGFWKQTFGKASGIDPRAREIEKRLGL